MKKCSKCKLELEDSSFYIGYRKEKPYLYSRCRKCCKELNDAYKEQGRDWELKKKYGITLEEYRKQTQLRGNYCDICDKEKPPLHVDHCHKTGKIRGYLCGSCNRAIGLLQESSQNAYNAAIYLKAHD